MYFDFLPLTNLKLNVSQGDFLSVVNIDPWYSAFYQSKPRIVERLVAIDDYDAQKKID